MADVSNDYDSAHKGEHVLPLLTLNDVAERLRVSKTGVERLVRRKELKSIRVGRRRLVTEFALRDFVIARMQAEVVTGSGI